MSMDPELEMQRNALRAFARAAGVADDWHEPDQQEVTAEVIGDKLDNAFRADEQSNELVIVPQDVSRCGSTSPRCWPWRPTARAPRRPPTLRPRRRGPGGWSRPGSTRT